MINSTQAPQPQVQTQQRPSFAPSYNAVQINLDTPTLNAPQAGYYYDYPVAQDQPYYPPVNTPAPQPNNPQAAPNVPAPAVETPSAPTAEAPKAGDVDIDKVVANLSSPDFDTQALQMDEIAKKGLTNEADAEPYVKEEVMNKLMDIVEFDSSKLEMPTEQQLQLRSKKEENDKTIEQAKAEGKDPSTVQLPHNLTPEEVALAEKVTPFEQAERNKEYALFTTAILQKTYADAIKTKTGNVVPLTDLPAAAMVVDTLKGNPNPVIRTAAIDSLRYLNCPEYKNDLSVIYTIAQNDADDVVSTAAKEALDDLNNPKEPAAPQQAA